MLFRGKIRCSIKYRVLTDTFPLVYYKWRLEKSYEKLCYSKKKPCQNLCKHFFSCRVSSRDFWCCRWWRRSGWRWVWFRWRDRPFRSRSSLPEWRRFGGGRWGRTPNGRRENQQSRRPAEVNWIHSFYSGKPFIRCLGNGGIDHVCLSSRQAILETD